MAMHFADPSLATLDAQWLLGSSLLVAPCLTGENETSHNTTDVYVHSKLFLAPLSMTL